MKTRKQYAVVIPLDKEREDLDTVIKVSEEKPDWGTIRLEQKTISSALTSSGSAILVEDTITTYFNGQLKALEAIGATKMGAKIPGMIQVLVSDESFLPEDHPKYGEDKVINPETEEDMGYFRNTRFLYDIHDAQPKLDWDEFREQNEDSDEEIEAPAIGEEAG